MKVVGWITIAGMLCFGGQATAANATELTACNVITAADAEKFVGGPLDVKEFAKISTGSSPANYDSVCTYIAKGEDPENATTASSLVD